MKVYIVSDGWYSDYHICGIYSTPEKAEEAKRVFNAGDIDELELDKVPDHPPGLVLWVFHMDRQGNSKDVSRIGAGDCENETWNPGLHGKEHVRFSIWARDEKHAVKVANERRIQLLASNEWTTDWEVWRAAQK